MSLSDIQFDFVKDVIKLLRYAKRKGFKITFGEAWRTEYQQAHYVKCGLSKTMNSQHLKRLAIDLNFFKYGVWIEPVKGNHKVVEKLGKKWEKLNPDNEWGGRWKKPYDPSHFQRKE